MTTPESSEVIAEIRGHAGVITLNRPKALNALTLDMVRSMTAALTEWRDNDAVKLVVLRGEGDRALCAGGDIAMLYRAAEAGTDEGATFWREEYDLNQLIADYPKPYVAIMNGIVLGGGVGVSAHGSHRIVTDDTRIGMPETGIGFIPDVGGTLLLAQAPDRLGYHLAYTAQHVGAAEAIGLGLADTFVPKNQLEALVSELVDTGDIATITKYATDPGEPFAGQRAEMVDVYSADSIEGVVNKLTALAKTNGDGHWAAKSLKRLRGNSPTSLVVTKAAIDRAGGKTLRQALDQEYKIANYLHSYPDFREGVRAQILDKDFAPKWHHKDVAEVPNDFTATLFDE